MQSRKRMTHLVMSALSLLLAVLATVPANADQDDLIIATREVPPFAMQDEDGNWTGITIELWEIIAAEKGWSYRYEPRSIEAMFNELERGEIDGAAAALTITSEREHRADFSHPFAHVGLGIAVAAQPQPTWLSVMRGMVSLQFMQALGVLLLILFIFGLLIWLFERRRNAEQFGGSAAEGVGAGFWWSAVTMTTVGYGDKAPITFGGRLIALIWMFAAIIVISSITAAITSALTVASLETGIRGPEDLPHATVGTVRATTSEDYLTARGIRARQYDIVHDALGALAAGQVEAVVYDAPILSYAIREHHAGKLTVLPREFEQQQYGIALQLDSPLRQAMNRTMLTLIEAGELDRIRQKYLGE
jgi:polar amino acid transport system substrate-binding protein